MQQNHKLKHFLDIMSSLTGVRGLTDRICNHIDAGEEMNKRRKLCLPYARELVVVLFVEEEKKLEGKTKAF